MEGVNFPIQVVHEFFDNDDGYSAKCEHCGTCDHYAECIEDIVYLDKSSYDRLCLKCTAGSSFIKTVKIVSGDLVEEEYMKKCHKCGFEFTLPERVAKIACEEYGKIYCKYVDEDGNVVLE